MLAAEAGKVLLEKNQELTHHYESLQDDYLRKIEVRHVQNSMLFDTDLIPKLSGKYNTWQLEVAIPIISFLL